MDYYPEFPLPTRRELETLRQYFRVERKFMPNENYLRSHRNRQIRKYAISTIARYSQGENLNAFIPYLAMNYFDRFVSKHSLPNTEANDRENVRLLAVCCLTIAWKMRKKTFSVIQFLRDKYLEIPKEKILNVEFAILDGLDWRMRSITAFCFLNYFYPRFKPLGGFKRRCINQIIIYSQGENNFTRYRPSVLAQSSFLAAARIAYPKEVILVLEEDVALCAHEMMEMCVKKKIQIERANSSFDASSIATATGGEQSSAEVASDGLKSTPRTSGEEGRSKSKIVHLTSCIPEIVPAEVASPKKLWNFDLQWMTISGESDDLIIPPLEIRGTSTASTRDVGNHRDISDSFNTGDPRANMLSCVCNIL